MQRKTPRTIHFGRAALFAAALIAVGATPQARAQDAAAVAAVRKRAHNFNGRIWMRDETEAVKFIDPDLLKGERGKEVTDFFMKGHGSAELREALYETKLLKKGAQVMQAIYEKVNLIVSFAIERVRLNEPKDQAEVELHFVVATGRNDAKGEPQTRTYVVLQKWILKNGDWFAVP